MADRSVRGSYNLLGMAGKRKKKLEPKKLRGKYMGKLRRSETSSTTRRRGGTLASSGTQNTITRLRSRTTRASNRARMSAAGRARRGKR